MLFFSSGTFKTVTLLMSFPWEIYNHSVGRKRIALHFHCNFPRKIKLLPCIDASPYQFKGQILEDSPASNFLTAVFVGNFVGIDACSIRYCKNYKANFWYFLKHRSTQKTSHNCLHFIFICVLHYTTKQNTQIHSVQSFVTLRLLAHIEANWALEVNWDMFRRKQ